MSAATVLITGTTSGVGRALLQHYVRVGAKVVAVNRRRVAELELEFPTVRFECVDVRLTTDVGELVHRLAAAGELPELFILNAGINQVDNDASFDLATFKDVLDTNLLGVISFAAPLTALSAGGVARHIVAISSVVSYAGNAYALGYHASKRALTACFDVWSRMYAGTDLVFQQVMLGPVRTAMHTMDDRLPAGVVWFKNLLRASMDGTVRAIARFADTRRAKLRYPWRAYVAFRALALGQRFVPGFFQGRKTLDGRSRRG